MNHPCQRLCGLTACGLGLSLLATAVSLQAEPIRFLTWNAQSFTNSAEARSSSTARVNSAALWLREFEADVLLLQELPDRLTAQTLATGLGEDYSVVTCSALQPGTPDSFFMGQVAIISRLPQTLAWTHEWKSTQEAPPMSGGSAFAVLQWSNQWISVHSALFPPETSLGTEAMRQLLRQTALTFDWKTNRPSANFLGATFPSIQDTASDHETILGMAEEAGFFSAFKSLPRDAFQTLRARGTRPGRRTDYLLADWGVFLGRPRIHWGIASDHACVVVDWDAALHAAPPPIAAIKESRDTGTSASPTTVETPLESAQAREDSVPVQEAPISIVPLTATNTSGQAPSSGENGAGTDLLLFGVHLKWWVAGLLIFSLALWLLILRRTRQRHADAHGLIAMPHSLEAMDESPEAASSERIEAEVKPHLLAWLKEKFVGRLVAQHRDMHQTHAQASDKADALGQRVERIQEDLLRRIRAAERQVKELEQDLAEAKAENRDLIQINLALAQRELEDVRKKAGLGMAR